MSKQLLETMAAIRITQPGGPEVLELADMPVPVPGRGEVLIAVSHAGVNRPDCLQRRGLYPPPPAASPLPGLEVSGTIVALGDGVDRGEQGKRVCALVNGGGYAPYAIARPDHCLPVPRGLSLTEAAAMPETLFTVWHNLFERGYPRDGETVLVHGGTSGIGTMAIALGKLFGLTVIVTCGSAAKCEAARALGADRAINYREEDFAEVVMAATDGRGANVILDMVAGDYTPRNLACLAKDGRLVVIAVQGGVQSEVNMAKLMVNRQTITGSTLRARSDAFKAMLCDEIFREVWPLVEDGALRPVMDRSFALKDAAEAHRRMEAGGHIGKIVLSVA